MNIFRNYLLSSVARAPDDGGGTADVGGSDIVERSAGGDAPLSPRDAALSLIDTRRKDNGQQPSEARDEDEPVILGEEESSSQEDGTGPETVPGETQADNPADKPSVEPPRSWTKEDKELFKGLPRETQERLVDRERSRESDFLKRQNEVTEKAKGLTAKETATEQARAQYEQVLPQLLQGLQQQQAGQFADIKSIDDVTRLAAEDWPRYVMWDAQQKKVAAVQQELMKVQTRQQEEQTQKWQTFAQEQDALFAEKAPEYADKEAMAKGGAAAADLLKSLGFTDAELGSMWGRGEKLSLRDHRVQLLIRDAVKFRDAQAATKKAATAGRTVPNVQRPGVAPARGADADARVKVLNDRLTQTGNIKDAAAALSAFRAARR